MKGYGFKQADQLTARFLNDVNDTVSGGTIFALPAAVQPPPYSATQPADAIIVDDAIAGALSDPAVGTLFGGVYMYVPTLSSSTQSPARGGIAFMRPADMPSAVTNLYQVTADPFPTAAIPTLIAGIFINAVTKGNFGWIQTAGVASVLFDSAITAAAVGNPVSAKISAAVAGTADVGVNVVTATIAFSYAGAYLGTAIVLPVISTITAVLLEKPLKRI